MASSAPRKQTRPHNEPLHDRETQATANYEHAINLFTHGDYSIGWICALPIERAAAEAMLDQFHDRLPDTPLDTNSYTLGNIGAHNIVIACLPSGHYGTNNAIAVAKDMMRSFHAIDTFLMVGIGGGAPTNSVDIRLGDIVVGSQVIQYDFGKVLPNEKFHSTGIAVRPPPILMTAISKLQALHERVPSEVPEILSGMIQRYPQMSNYAHPGTPDKLFRSSYNHILSDTCDGCDGSELQHRASRTSTNPKIHYGRIGSGNKVIKDGTTRDRYSRTCGVVCFEMEAAGLVDHFNCLVIRGICDYSDSHKNKEWQKYAAAVAAAYAKELLPLLPIKEVQNIKLDERTARYYRDRLLESLDFEQRKTRHTIIKDSHASTCEWLLEDPHYIDWLDSSKFNLHHGFLWISGKPGAGKSTIMKFCFTRTQTELKATPNTAVISFFFNSRGVKLEKSALGMYRSLLYQLFESFPRLKNILDDFFYLIPKDTHDKVIWSLEILQAIFNSAIQKLDRQRVRCYIDALDECDEDEARGLIEQFEQLGGLLALQNSTAFHICFSSRHYPYIRIQKGQIFTLEDHSGHTADLRQYIQGKLQVGEAKDAKEIRNKILDKSAGVFMWVILVIAILNKEYERGRLFAVQRRLQEVPAKLGELFKQILTRDSDNVDDLLLCIQWIIFAKRPLRPEELYFALVSGLAPAESTIEWDSESINTEVLDRFVLSASKGLAELTKSKTDNTVQFIHESVKDYLLEQGGIYDLWPEHASNFEAFSHDRLRHCCNQYIKVDLSSFASTDAMLELAKKIARNFPFLEYATYYLLHHAEAACRTLPQDIFLKSFEFEYWLELQSLFAVLNSRNYPPDTTLMYILAENDFINLTRSAIRVNFESKVPAESDALIPAASNGHTAIVALLVEVEGVNVNVRDESGRTPLSLAAGAGHEAIVKLLLNTKGVEPDSRSSSGLTPLSLAAESGHETIVKLLLTNKAVNPDSRSISGLTPLAWAAESGHTAIVKLLLDSEAVDPESRSNIGQTPLSLAVESRHREITLLALEWSRTSQNFDNELSANLVCSVTGGAPVNFSGEFGHRLRNVDFNMPAM